jgi:hypothetical protein
MPVLKWIKTQKHHYQDRRYFLQQLILLLFKGEGTVGGQDPLSF